MAITSYSSAVAGDIVTITVVSDLVGDVRYYWYVDGAFFAMTTGASFSTRLEPGEPARIECVDTLSTTFDPVSGAPLAYPARRNLFWVRSPSTDVDHYRVEQQVNEGEWTEIARLGNDVFAWTYQHLTGRLTDLAAYAWRIVPVDTAGNDGTAVAIAASTIVRTPDGPAFDIAFDEETSKVTFSEA